MIISNAWEALGAWKILGIEKTTDKRAIKRAYATKLKLTNPEDNPDGFKELRSAYEFANSYAENPDYYDYDDDNDDDYDNASVPTNATPDEQTIIIPDENEFTITPHETENIKIDTASTEPAAPIYVDFSNNEKSEFENKFSELNDLVELNNGPWKNEAAIKEFFLEILRHPYLDNISNYSEFNDRIAYYISENIPKTDPLIDIAIQSFNWKQNDTIGYYNWYKENIFQRKINIEILSKLNTPANSRHTAYKALQAPPPKYNLINRLLHKNVTSDVENLLDYIKIDAPNFIEDIDDDKIKTWEGYINSEKEFSTYNLYAIIGAPIFFMASFFPNMPENFRILLILIAITLAIIFSFGSINFIVSKTRDKNEQNHKTIIKTIDYAAFFGSILLPFGLIANYSIGMNPIITYIFLGLAILISLWSIFSFNVERKPDAGKWTDIFVKNIPWGIFIIGTIPTISDELIIATTIIYCAPLFASLLNDVAIPYKDIKHHKLIGLWLPIFMILISIANIILVIAYKTPWAISQLMLIAAILWAQMLLGNTLKSIMTLEPYFSKAIKFNNIIRYLWIPISIYWLINIESFNSVLIPIVFIISAVRIAYSAVLLYSNNKSQ